jgi:hypothetical protein
MKDPGCHSIPGMAISAARWAVLAACLLGNPVAACRRGGAPLHTTIRVDSAGVEIVDNVGADLLPPWSLLPVRRVGSENAATWIRVRDPAFAAADLTGRIYLLLHAEHQVVVLDTLGRRLSVLGDSGTGRAGVLSFPVRVEVSPGGPLGVLDFGKKALILFDTNGTLSAERRFSEIGTPASRAYPLDSIGTLHDEVEYGDTVLVERLLVQSGPDSAVLATVSASSPGEVRFRCGLTFRGLPQLFSPSLSWSTGAGMTVVTHQLSYDIQVFVNKRLVRLIRRHLAARPATIADVSRRYPRGWTIGEDECRVQPEELASSLGIARTLPVIQGLRIGPDGSLWVERFSFDAEPAKVDVFDVAGNYLGTLVGASLPVGFLPRGQLLTAPVDASHGGRMLVIQRLAPSPWQ